MYFSKAMKLDINMDNVVLNIVEPRAAKQFSGFGGITSASVRVSEDGMIVVFEVNGVESVLGSTRGGVRIFYSIDAAASAVKQLGMTEFKMNLEGWSPKKVIKNK
jgi:hypothetical protein